MSHADILCPITKGVPQAFAMTLWQTWEAARLRTSCFFRVALVPFGEASHTYFCATCIVTERESQKLQPSSTHPQSTPAQFSSPGVFCVELSKGRSVMRLPRSSECFPRVPRLSRFGVLHKTSYYKKFYSRVFYEGSPPRVLDIRGIGILFEIRTGKRHKNHKS